MSTHGATPQRCSATPAENSSRWHAGSPTARAQRAIRAALREHEWLSHDDLVAVVRQVVPPEYAWRRRNTQLDADRDSWRRKRGPGRRFGKKPVDLGVEVELSYGYILGTMTRAMRGNGQLVRETRDGQKGFRLARDVPETRSAASKAGWETRRLAREAGQKVRALVYGALTEHTVLAVADLSAQAAAVLTPEEAEAHRRKYAKPGKVRMPEDRYVASDLVARVIASLAYRHVVARLGDGRVALLRPVRTVYSERTRAGWAVREEDDGEG